MLFRLFSRKSTLDKRHIEALSRVQDDLVDLIERFNRLSMQHQKLSGRFYARFGTGDAPEAGQIPELRSKDDLRRLAGITAGRPANHRG